ncbi:hypothetical protein HMPREF1544_06117 [Mucor circinelloides 1006PhL]|uniref:Uncharacterized protein n=1 Tax=Mucor circinelloides f. circinelloides (strain 1006PhL) TaxID=1220926 RepID=S2JWB7_MUCC1|nr:hypothetical protein HMPREF1544_06117 [Mucor circinelloides 1006PhL]KAG1081780.1 hypothetical protein G6F42_022826 [Rhizopus arrhizus]
MGKNTLNIIADTLARAIYRDAIIMLINDTSGDKTLSHIVTFTPAIASLYSRKSANSDLQLKESITVINIHGKVVTIFKATTESSDIKKSKFLESQSHARQCLVFTTTGMSTLNKQRPADMLHSLLLPPGSDI